jgi:hypothetical protein
MSHTHLHCSKKLISEIGFEIKENKITEKVPWIAECSHPRSGSDPYLPAHRRWMIVVIRVVTSNVA